VLQRQRGCSEARDARIRTNVRRPNAPRFAARQNTVYAFLLNKNRAGGAKCGLKQPKQLGSRYRSLGRQSDASADARVNEVVQFEGVSKNGTRDGVDVGVIKDNLKFVTFRWRNAAIGHIERSGDNPGGALAFRLLRSIDD